VKEEEARRDWKGQDNAAPDSSFLTVKEGKSFRLRDFFIFRSVFGYRQKRKRIIKKEERSNETVNPPASGTDNEIVKGVNANSNE